MMRSQTSLAHKCQSFYDPLTIVKEYAKGIIGSASTLIDDIERVCHTISYIENESRRTESSIKTILDDESLSELVRVIESFSTIANSIRVEAAYILNDAELIERGIEHMIDEET